MKKHKNGRHGSHTKGKIASERSARKKAKKLGPVEHYRILKVQH